MVKEVEVDLVLSINEVMNFVEYLNMGVDGFIIVVFLCCVSKLC